MASHRHHTHNDDNNNPKEQPPTTFSPTDTFCVTSQDWKDVESDSKFNIVIIGSGFCGYAVAEKTLRRDPDCRVLLLEQGAFFLPDHFQNLPPSFMNIWPDSYETYPWSISENTAKGQSNAPVWLHGAIPFLGGKSTLWSGWCPSPTEEELVDWPSATKKAILDRLEDARGLLRVRGIDELAKSSVSRRSSSHRDSNGYLPIFATLQEAIQSSLEKFYGNVDGIYRTESAPLSSAAKESQGVDFAKFSVPENLLKLAIDANSGEDGDRLERFKIVTGCGVKKIDFDDDGKGVSLQTTLGTLPLHDANLVLAMGTLPTTTLVLNSIPDARHVGERCSAHFISRMTAQVPIDYLNTEAKSFLDLEMGAWYIRGVANGDYHQQFHIQLSAVWNKNPKISVARMSRYWPDALAMASQEQLEQSKEHIIFTCAVLGELDVDNENNWFRRDPSDLDRIKNPTLQVTFSEKDMETWDAMDNATFDLLETVLSTDPKKVKYWHDFKTNGKFNPQRPTVRERRMDSLVHESSTMAIGDDDDAVVDIHYKLRGTDNIYVTGGALWPRGGSWNPATTMVATSQDLAAHLMPERI